MSIQNLIYAGLITSTAIVASSNLSSEDISKLIRESRMQYGNPYDEIVLLYDESFIIETPIIKKIEEDKTMKNWSSTMWLAKMLYTERVNPKDDEELRHIAATALNRCLLNNETIKQVCSNKKQFSGVMRPDNKNWIKNPSEFHLKIAEEMIKEYQNGVPEIYKNSFFFANMDIVKKTNQKAAKWFMTLTKVREFKVDGHGTHTMFTSDKFKEWLLNNPNAKLEKKHL